MLKFIEGFFNCKIGMFVDVSFFVDDLVFFLLYVCDDCVILFLKFLGYCEEFCCIIWGMCVLYRLNWC